MSSHHIRLIGVEMHANFILLHKIASYSYVGSCHVKYACHACKGTRSAHRQGCHRTRQRKKKKGAWYVANCFHQMPTNYTRTKARPYTT